jgi:hypothetical protein
LLEPSANLRLTELPVIPGRVDAHAQCQMLALKLRERTGWPLWVAGQQARSGERKWVHVAVRTPVRNPAM